MAAACVTVRSPIRRARRSAQARSLLIARCQRCQKPGEARQRVKSDIMNISVCDICAEVGRNLGLAVDEAAAVKKETRRNKLSPGAPDELP